MLPKRLLWPLPLALSGCLLASYPYKEDRPLVEIVFDNPEPTTVDDLNAQVVLNDDRLEIEVSDLRWFLGREIEDLAGQDTVPSDRTRKGELWTMTAQVAGIDTEPRTVQGSVEIGNSAPELTSVTLSPAAPTVADGVNVVWEGSDPDTEDPVTAEVAFFVNGSEAQRGSETTLGPGLAVKGDAVTVEVTLTDGEATTAPLVSDEVVVVNSPPTAPEVALRPAEPGPDDDLWCEVVTASTDADGDPLTTTFTWEVDGAAYTGPTTRTALDGDTVPGAQTVTADEDEVWSCAVAVSDGEAEVEDGSEEVVVAAETTFDGNSPTLGTMHLAPAGSFTMGCDPSRDLPSDSGLSACRSDETTRTVTLTGAIYVMESEVTQKQWRDLMGTSPSYFDGCDDCPVERVNWWEALAFANAASRAEGLAECYTLSGCTGTLGGGCGTSSGCTGDYTCSSVSIPAGSPYDCEGYRLPTEAEWEYAARGGESFGYAGSDTVGDVGWYSGNSDPDGDGTRSTQPVCGLDANGYGLCDMSGNVWEWAWDWYGTYPSSAETDPVGPGAGSDRVFRGGDWIGTPQALRVARRYYSPPALRNNRIGFRLVRAAP